MKVLIVEDDRETAEFIKNGLTAEGHMVEVVHDGAEGSFLGRSFEYDAIVLDYSLPKKNGLAITKEIRGSGRTTPVLFLTVSDDSETKLSAFDSGADDYLTKPFLFKELYARLKALTRRPARIEDPVITISDLSIETARHTATRGKDQIHMTRKEFSMLEYFMKNAGIVLSRSLLMEHVWTADGNPFSNTLEAHISSLRKKLNEGGKPNMIANIPGRGYVLDTPENLAKL